MLYSNVCILDWIANWTLIPLWRPIWYNKYTGANTDIGVLALADEVRFKSSACAVFAQRVV
jgi:hypothetical protein